MYTRRAMRFFLCFLFGISLSGCMVGPNFRRPFAPPVGSYLEKPFPRKTVAVPSVGKAGKAQTFVKGANIPAEWWYLFHSPALNSLIVQGLGYNPNLSAAYANLRVAQENVNVQIGNSLFPAFNAVLSGQRQRYSTASIGGAGRTDVSNVFNLFNASVNVSYTLDVFGGARREIESLRAQVDYQQFQLIAAHLSLTANIVTTAVTIASLVEQIQVTHELLRAQESTLNILRKQLHLGGIAKDIVLTQQTLVEQTRATLPPLEKSLSQQRHALAALIGTFPNQPLPRLRLKDFTLPIRLPISIPSFLVRQRPDVRASEALLHAATAQIGVATANLLPQFTITGYYGWQGPVFSQLFDPINKTWSYMGQITQPLFHGGALLASRRGAIAACEQAFAQYRQVVLQAFQNVADSLRAIETDARTLRAQKRAEDAAHSNLILTQDQYRLGGASYLALLNAQQQYQSTRLSRIQAEAARFTDTAALFQALGGGWWNKPWCVKECF